MNRNNQRSKLSILILIVLFVAARGAPLAAQNVRIGNDDKGASYTMTGTEATTQPITFTSSGAVVIVNMNQTWSAPITMIGSGTFQINNPSDGTTIFTQYEDLAGAGTFIKTGTGTFELQGISTLTGNTNINAGTFKVSAGGVISKDTAVILTSGGTLDIASANNDQKIGSLEGSGTVKLGTKSLTVGGNNTDTAFSGSLTGSGNLTKTGAGTMQINSDVSALTGTIYVESGGTLGGNGILGTVVIESGATLAPGADPNYTDKLTIDKLTLENASTLRIRINDSGYDDSRGHDQIIISSGQSGYHDNGANLKIDAIAGVYSNLLSYSHFLVDSSGGELTDFDPGTVDVTLDQDFLDSSWENNNTLTIQRKSNYFLDKASTPNQQQVARALDNASSTGPWNAMTQISQWIKNNPNDLGSVQAAYNDLAGDLKANSMMIGQWQTSRYGLNHLDLTECGLSQGNGVWLEFIHQSTDFSGDANSGDYGISRTGFLIGSEERRADVTYGFFVGYAYPYLYDHGDKVEVNDLQFGFYGGSKVREFLETKLFIGYGHQGYKSRRYLTSEPLAGLSDDNRIDGDYSGDSMSMALEFAVPLSAGMVSLRPLFAIDSDLTWQYAFGETGDTGVELWYDRGFLNRTYLRTGVTTQLGSVSQCDTLALMGRLYYGHQVFGDSRPETRCKFATETTADRMTIYGVDPGKDYIDLGLGFRWNIDSCRSFYGDYDFNAFSDSTAHWGSLGYMQKW